MYDHAPYSAAAMRSSIEQCWRRCLSGQLQCRNFWPRMRPPFASILGWAGQSPQPRSAHSSEHYSCLHAPHWCLPLTGASPSLVPPPHWCLPLPGASPSLVPPPPWCPPPSLVPLSPPLTGALPPPSHMHCSRRRTQLRPQWQPRVSHWQHQPSLPPLLTHTPPLLPCSPTHIQRPRAGLGANVQRRLRHPNLFPPPPPLL